MWRDPEVEQLVVDTIEEHVATTEELLEEDDDVVDSEQYKYLGLAQSRKLTQQDPCV